MEATRLLLQIRIPFFLGRKAGGWGGMPQRATMPWKRLLDVEEKLGNCTVDQDQFVSGFGSKRFSALHERNKQGHQCMKQTKIKQFEIFHRTASKIRAVYGVQWLMLQHASLPMQAWPCYQERAKIEEKHRISWINSTWNLRPCVVGLEGSCAWRAFNLQSCLATSSLCYT